MAPEMLTRKTVGPPADMYSLAAVGCYLLTGKPIFDAETVGQYVMAHQTLDPVPPSRRNPDVPADLEAVLLRALRKVPEERLADAREMRAALLACRDAGRWTAPDAERWWKEHGNGRLK